MRCSRQGGLVLRIVHAGSTDNIEAVARDIYSRNLGRYFAGEEFAADVDMYWHCMAAQLDAGIIDETVREMVEYDLDTELAVYRDWFRRHPETCAAWEGARLTLNDVSHGLAALRSQWPRAESKSTIPKSAPRRLICV